MNVKNLIYLLLISLILSCNNNRSEPNSNTTQKIDSTNEEKSVANLNLVNDSLNYIIKYGDKYPYEVKLLDSGMLKDRLIRLLGNKMYKMYISYTDVQSPIEIVNQKRTLISTCAAHSGQTYTTATYIDFQTDELTVGILDDTIVYTYSESTKKLYAPDFQTWEINSKELAERNKEWKNERKNSTKSLIQFND